MSEIWEVYYSVLFWIYCKIFFFFIQALFLLVAENAAVGPSWCKSSAICFNSTHFNLCVGYERGFINKWEKPLSCPINSQCNSSRCEENYPAPPYIYDTIPCGAYGFTCANRYEFRICKYNRNNYSVPFSWSFHCPSNTVCDENYEFHCRDSGYAIYNLPSPSPPPPGFHFPPPQPPVAPVIPSYPPVTRDECKGKDFVCTDSKSYLLCRNMGDGTIRTEKEQYKCPKGKICHKSFDRPCAGSGAGSYHNYYGFSLGILMSIVIVCMKVI